LGDKVSNQLDKSVSGKLEAALARQIQMQCHTSIKQALQVRVLVLFSFIDDYQVAINSTSDLAILICFLGVYELQTF
jgi:hypothetical protein